MDAIESLNNWEQRAKLHSYSREEYRAKWAIEFSSRETVKPETARKAATDAVTSDLRKMRDSLEIEAMRAWQEFLILRGPTDFSRQPGQKFGGEG
jgi:DNA-binding FadR family transcriptional regulator